VIFSSLAIGPCKNAEGEDPIIEGKGETCDIFGFEAEICSRADARVVFDLGCPGGFHEIGNCAFQGLVLFFRLKPLNGVQSVTLHQFLENLLK